MSNQVAVDDGGKFWSGSSGRWAGERILKALQENREVTPAVLRDLDTLRKDEWIQLDEALVQEGLIRLRIVADLIAAGLTIPVANAMGRSVFQWEQVSFMNPAEQSLSGVNRSDDDRQEFNLNNLPLYLTHKDFNINLRQLMASRNRGESLDVMQARTAGRLVAESVEASCFVGGKTFGGIPTYGLLNHPNRNTIGFGSNGAWDAAAKTGENIIADVLSMIQAAQADRFFGPYHIYVPSVYGLVIENDFKANSDKTIRQRILEIDQVEAVTTVDQITAANVVLVQMTPDVISLVQGEPLQTVQWDIEGGFIVKFKAFAIQVPLIRSDIQGRSGVVHMS